MTIQTKKPFTAARYEQFRVLLDSPFDWLFICDEDTIPPNGAVQSCLGVAKEKGAKIVFMPVLQIADISKHVASNIAIDSGQVNERGQTIRELQAIKLGMEPFTFHSAGLACALIHREVLENMPQPWFTHTYLEDGTLDEEADYRWCRIAREIGYDLWCNPRLGACEHIKLTPMSVAIPQEVKHGRA